MLDYLKHESNYTYTENGALTHITTESDLVDLFATLGALRGASDAAVTDRFARAFAERSDLAMKLAFYGRDVRGGLGERRVFRLILKWLAKYAPDALRRNLEYIPEYGRYDDLLTLVDTQCENDVIELIRGQLESDRSSDAGVSLLAKWLPSVNASNCETVKQAKHIARRLGMNDAAYRRLLSELRAKIAIIENNLRERDYTFDYSKQPSQAMLKYRKAFIRNDKERYFDFLESVRRGEVSMHTDTLTPYDIISPCFDNYGDISELSETERRALDTAWNSLDAFSTDENSLAVVDGSGSMYCNLSPRPIAVAMSLGIYFAERCKGAFHNHFITFSERPRLVEVKGADIVEKVEYCSKYNEVANTNLSEVFKLILRVAVGHSLPQSELPKRLYIISDMEFDSCTRDSDMTNFEYAKRLYLEHGYKLPEIVFWNVASRKRQQPVTQNEAGVALVSGCSQHMFKLAVAGELSPVKLMYEILTSERYAKITA